jgi:hypothetical protein
MSLKWLVHREVTATLSLSRIKLENLEKTLISSNSNIAFILVPSN